MSDSHCAVDRHLWDGSKSLTLKRVARTFDASAASTQKWWQRYRAEGRQACSSAPAGPRESVGDAAASRLAAKVLRWQRWICVQIARALSISRAAAARILRRSGLS